MNTQKGYIIPVFIILILLLVAGFFIFFVPETEAPILLQDVPQVTTTSIPEEDSNVETGE